ncbi:hypothetical protein ISU10_22085 [Nocardioides agariphilus]|jgi:hypothetical protein|uniref:Uncharacterized protein n=1 Tax=Nocardioides agariphilus TaxID=433664 RepID=A0A930YKJ3_9ACTN|nr:hypothetical protein [Nocardioides agariphilus]MBF4770472.1 hypothetical protein [Nocardioides agariphilus]
MTDQTIPFRPVVRSQSDLHSVWNQLMEPQTSEGGFGGHSLWLLVIEGDRPFPQLTEITEALEPPDDDMVTSLGHFLENLSAEGRRFAFLRSRPGHGGLTSDDRAWARSLYEAGRRAGVPLEVVHRACDHDLVAVPMDEVA